MTPLDAAVEKAAEALWRAMTLDPELRWEDGTESLREVFRVLARAVIEALGLTEETRDNRSGWTIKQSLRTVEHRLVTPWETT